MTYKTSLSFIFTEFTAHVIAKHPEPQMPSYHSF